MDRLLIAFDLHYYASYVDVTLTTKYPQVDSPMMSSEWKRPGMLSHFTVVRKLDGGIFPMGFTKEVADINSKASSIVLATDSRHGSIIYYISISYFSCSGFPLHQSCMYFGSTASSHFH